MKAQRRLALRKEALVALSPDELQYVAGGEVMMTGPDICVVVTTRPVVVTTGPNRLTCGDACGSCGLTCTAISSAGTTA